MADKPDWRKASEYPTQSKTSMKRWAWEFLRRNPEYRSDWGHCFGLYAEISPSYNPLVTPSSGADPNELARLSDRFHKKEAAKVYFIGSGELWDGDVKPIEKGSFTWLHVWYAREWGIDILCDPFAEYEPMRLRFKISSCQVGLAARWWNGFDDRTKMVPIIDLAKPLDIQLDAIEFFAKTAQAELVKENAIMLPIKKREQDYRLYLRVLDALEDVAEESEAKQVKYIGDGFYSKKNDSYPDYSRSKTARATIKAAKRLRDEDFRYLPLLRKLSDEVKK